MNLTLELQQKKSALLDKTEAIIAKAESDKRGLTADEQASVKENMESVEGINVLIQSRTRLSAASGNGGRLAADVQVRDLYLEKPFGYDRSPTLWDNKATETAAEK